jgi:hypothetical protein
MKGSGDRRRPGDCTIVLAETIGPEGHITAVDLASLDYGTNLYLCGDLNNDKTSYLLTHGRMS